MKILLHKGIHPPKDGIVLPCQGPISLQSLKSSKFHSSTERAKNNVTKPPKSGLKTLSLLSLIRKCTTTPSSSQQLEVEATTPHSTEPQPSQT